nr:obg-like ATPase 1 [Oncorhynchus nerka]
MASAFADEDIVHVEGNVDPVRDIEIIHEELRLKDEEMIGPIMEKLEKVAARGCDKKLKPEYDVTLQIKNWVADEKKRVRYCRGWTEKEIEVLNKYLFLTSQANDLPQRKTTSEERTNERNQGSTGSRQDPRGL